MAPEKRTIIAISGALAVAFALPGCAPAGYNQADYGGGTAADAQPAANAAAVEASPEPAAKDDAEGAEKADTEKADAEKDAPELSDDELTNELKAVELPRMGEAVTDEEGWVYYRFEKDTNKPAVSNCAGDCAKAWPPALTDGDPKLEGISSDLVGTVQRADGTRQLTIDGWPIYRFAKDQKPGQWKGQGAQGTWFVVAPDGKRNVECLPPGVKVPSGSGGGEEEADDKGEKGDKGAEDKGAAGGGDYNY